MTTLDFYEILNLRYVKEPCTIRPFFIALHIESPGGSMNLEQEIEGWNGKSSNDIDDIYHRHQKDELFISKIIAISRNPDLQKGSTWLLKRHLQSGKKIANESHSQLLRILPHIKKWEPKLHILQCLPYIDIKEQEKKTVEHFLRYCLIDKNKFVRAWAYSGFHQISTQYPEYKDEAKEMLKLALKNEAPSVKSRIRNITKGGLQLK